jgi:phosphate transport system permease protein
MKTTHLRESKRFNSDRFFIGLTRSFGVVLILLIISILFSLLVLSWPSIHKFGFSFLWHFDWNPVTKQFGAGTIILGTLVTAIIGMFFAIPLSFGVAVLITQVLPEPIKHIVARLVELMAGIPSIIYGMWGLFYLGPYMAQHIQPWLIEHCQNIPVLNFIFGGLPIGIGIFTAGIILAIMVIPLISSVMRDVLASVPVLMREAAYGVGMTRWEVVWKILVPYTRAGMLGGIILGFGRALGETMAVTFVIGNSHSMFTGLFMPGTTISATIANEFNEATGKLYPSSLMELGLILFVITFIVLSISRYFLKHSKQTRGGSQ